MITGSQDHRITESCLGLNRQFSECVLALILEGYQLNLPRSQEGSGWWLGNYLMTHVAQENELWSQMNDHSLAELLIVENFSRRTWWLPPTCPSVLAQAYSGALIRLTWWIRTTAKRWTILKHLHDKPYLKTQSHNLPGLCAGSDPNWGLRKDIWFRGSRPVCSAGDQTRDVLNWVLHLSASGARHWHWCSCWWPTTTATSI